MQHVTAFSRPETVPPVAALVPKRNVWILDSWRDLILYVGTPLLIIPLFTLAQARWSAQEIYLFVAAFGAMGHHLPGMIRAYGDRALFERFRWRFIIAAIYFAGRDSRPPANFVLCRSGDIDSVAGELREDVGCRNPTESG